MDRIFACAWGLRSTAPTSMLGKAEIGSELGAAGDLVHAVGAQRRREPTTFSCLARVVSHAQALLISSAASSTARTILS